MRISVFSLAMVAVHGKQGTPNVYFERTAILTIKVGLKTPEHPFNMVATLICNQLKWMSWIPIFN